MRRSNPVLLTFVYGIEADAAFDVLCAQTLQQNVTLVLIAELIRKDMVDLGTSGDAAMPQFGHEYRPEPLTDDWT